MKRCLAAVVLAAGLLSGCAADSQSPPADTALNSNSAGGHQSASGDSHSSSSNAAAPADPVVAIVRGQEIRMSELQKPLIEAYGLNVLLAMVQLDLAEQESQRQSITISPADLESEISQTLIAFRKATNQDITPATTEPSTQPSDETLAPADRQRLLATLLTSQHLTEVEFNLIMRCNAILRKLVQPQATAALTDENIHAHFNSLYGEKARVRYIRLPDMLAVSKIDRELQSGKTFAEEMRLHAYDAMGRPAVGDPPPFTQKDLDFPTEFKEVAFGLKPNEVSQAVQVKESLFLIQLVELIPPQHADFNEYKDWVRQDLYNRTVQGLMKEDLQKMVSSGLETMTIREPTLRQQWNLKLHSADELQQQLRKAQSAATTEPAGFGPAAPAPATAGPATVPSK